MSYYICFTWAQASLIMADAGNGAVLMTLTSLHVKTQEEKVNTVD